MIDTGQTVEISRAALDLVKKFAPQPVRYVIHTEPHSDHTVGDFIFSPPAVVIAAAGRTLEQAKAEIRMPEFDDWSGKERFGTSVEAAWKAVKK